MKFFNKHYIKQQDQSDCGVACLQMVLSYYGGKESFERLRELSGTQQTGTTMLGLVQAAKELHLDVQAFKGNCEELKNVNFPAILHITKSGSLTHYVVVFAYQNGTFTVADPADGMVSYSVADLEKVWISKALLVFQNTSHFKTEKSRKNQTISWLVEQISQDANRLILSLVLGLVIATLSLVISLFTQQLIDTILPNKNSTLFVLGLSLTFILLLFQNGISFLRTRFILEQSRDFNSRVVHWFLDKLLKLPQVFFDTRTTGDFVSRLQDTSKLQRVISYVVGELGIAVLVLFSTLLVIFLYSTALGFLVVAWVPILSLPIFFF